MSEKLTVWIARDKSDEDTGRIFIHVDKPYLDEEGEFYGGADFAELPTDAFPDILNGECRKFVLSEEK